MLQDLLLRHIAARRNKKTPIYLEIEASPPRERDEGGLYTRKIPTIVFSVLAVNPVISPHRREMPMEEGLSYHGTERIHVPYSQLIKYNLPIGTRLPFTRAFIGDVIFRHVDHIHMDEERTCIIFLERTTDPAPVLSKAYDFSDDVPVPEKWVIQDPQYDDSGVRSIVQSGGQLEMVTGDYDESGIATIPILNILSSCALKISYKFSTGSTALSNGLYGIDYGGREIGIDNATFVMLWQAYLGKMYYGPFEIEQDTTYKIDLVITPLLGQASLTITNMDTMESTTVTEVEETGFMCEDGMQEDFSSYELGPFEPQASEQWEIPYAIGDNVLDVVSNPNGNWLYFRRNTLANNVGAIYTFPQSPSPQTFDGTHYIEFTTQNGPHAGGTYYYYVGNIIDSDDNVRIITIWDTVYGFRYYDTQFRSIVFGDGFSPLPGYILRVRAYLDSADGFHWEVMQNEDGTWHVSDQCGVYKGGGSGNWVLPAAKISSTLRYDVPSGASFYFGRISTMWNNQIDYKNKMDVNEALAAFSFSTFGLKEGLVLESERLLDDVEANSIA